MCSPKPVFGGGCKPIHVYTFVACYYGFLHLFTHDIYIQHMYIYIYHAYSTYLELPKVYQIHKQHFGVFYTFNSTPSCHYLKKSVDSMRSHMGGKSSPAKNQCSLAELYGAVASQDVDCQVSVLFVRRFAHAIFQLLYISIYKLKLSLSSMICSCICRTVFFVLRVDFMMYIPNSYSSDEQMA